MTRLTWRQFRVPALALFAAVAAVAVVALLTGPGLAHLYADAMVACHRGGDCSSANQAFVRDHSPLVQAADVLVTVVPGLSGMFWGAPLIAREIESGTLQLIWTQTVTRTRWLLVKLGVLGLASALVSGSISLIVTWWARPMDDATAAVYGTFGSRNLVPIGYAAFAFAFGVTSGLLIRRTVPAMAATLFGFVAVRIGMTFGIRPRLVYPVHQALALDPTSTGFGSALSPSLVLKALFNGGPSSALAPSTPDLPNAWIYSTRVVDGAGKDLTNAVLNATCPGVTTGGGAAPTVSGHTPVSHDVQQQAQTCVSKIGATYHELVTYQPASRYWSLQWEEFALYVVAAFLLCVLCLWLVRRRNA